MAGTGFFGASVAPGLEDSLGEILLMGTFYQQHLGESFAGFAVGSREGISVQAREGLVSSFESDLQPVSGKAGIGFCGITREPFLLESRLGDFAVCVCGRITNGVKLKEQLKEEGYSFSGRKGFNGEAEIVSKLISQEKDIISGIKKLYQRIEGACSLLVLTEEGVFAVCSPTGHWPIVLAKKEKMVAVAIDSSGFSKLGLSVARSIRPGEIVRLQNGKWESMGQIVKDQVQVCSFLWAYTLFPRASVRGVVASEIRKKMGAALAKEDIEAGFVPDIVAPVPNSGRLHAIGYHQEFCQQITEGRINKVPLFDELLLKYPYLGRSFVQPTQEERSKTAKMKMLASGECYSGQRVVIVDDSVVRGTQLQANIIPMLRGIGVREVHVRISYPELLSYCPWGKSTREGEMLSTSFPEKEDKLQELGAESLKYNSLSALVKALGLSREQICLDCARCGKQD